MSGCCGGGLLWLRSNVYSPRPYALLQAAQAEVAYTIGRLLLRLKPPTHSPPPARRCKAQAEGCEGLSRRRLQTFYVSGNCCDGLYCCYDASETNAVCASKPSNPSIVDVGVDTSGGTLKLRVMVQGSADEGVGATPLSECCGFRR